MIGGRGLNFNLVQKRDKRRVYVNTVMNHRVHKIRGICCLAWYQFLNHSHLWNCVVAYICIMWYLTSQTFSLFRLQGQNQNIFYLLNKENNQIQINHQPDATVF
jgi:hypothetical protein